MKKKEYTMPLVEAIALQMELLNSNSPQLEKPEPGGEIDPWSSVSPGIDGLF